ncbi:MAG: hypothetical protein WA476_21290 [Acidobacteriaceae bacterium]
MIDKLANIPLQLASASLPWLPAGRHHGRAGLNHPLASLIVLVLLLALIFWAFRRKPS